MNFIALGIDEKEVRLNQRTSGASNKKIGSTAKLAVKTSESQLL